MSILISTPGAATEFRVVLAPAPGGDGEIQSRALWKFFYEDVGPGDKLSVWDGRSNKRIAKVTVPDDKRYAVKKRKARKFAGAVKKMTAFAKNPGGASRTVATLDMLSVLLGVGDNRISETEDIHVLLLGAPVQRTHDPEWSMVGKDGALLVPTDAAMLSKKMRTPYSVVGRGGMLGKVAVHVCHTSQPKFSRVQTLALRHMWGHWVRAQGGILATWSDDLAVCFERMAARVSRSVKLGPANLSFPPAMMQPVWNESQRGQNDGAPTPDIYNVFFKARHPNIPGLFVFTGVAYKPELFPARYENAWCYFNNAANGDGIEVRINVANKRFGKDPITRSVSAKQLKAAGATRKDFELARSVCRFPGDSE